jgi:hypothetical protein
MRHQSRSFRFPFHNMTVSFERSEEKEEKKTKTDESGRLPPVPRHTNPMPAR